MAPTLTVRVTIRRTGLGYQWSVDDMGETVRRGWESSRGMATTRANTFRAAYYRKIKQAAVA